MLILEPVAGYENKFPPWVAHILRWLAETGFSGSMDRDLTLINLGLLLPITEKDGKFYYDGKVAGYLRYVRDSDPHRQS